MITSDIFEIFSQFIVGAYTLFVVFFTIWLFSFTNKKFVDWLKQLLKSVCSSDSGTHTKGVIVTIFFMFAFGVGLFIHSVIDDLVDANPRMNWFGLGIDNITGSETGYRFLALYEKDEDHCVKSSCLRLNNIFDDGECDKGTSYKLKSLGKEILKDKSVILHHVDFGNKLHISFLNHPESFLKGMSGDPLSKLKCDVAKHFSRKIFYNADYFSSKNLVVNNTIKRWESEINFMGGMLLLSLPLLFIVSIFLVFRVAQNLYENKKLTLPTQFHYLFKVILVLIPSVVLMTYGYAVSMRSQTEKIIGTYASGINLNQVEFKNVTNSKSDNPKLSATMWMRNSREYAFITEHIYRQAYIDIEKKLSKCTKQTCAVILDLDETVLSNAQYETILRNSRINHDAALMDRWWEGAIKRDDLPLVPGAKIFINKIKEDVSVVYITARAKSREPITKAILVKAGLFTGDNNLLFSDKQDKKIRRGSIEQLYNNVLAYFGDQIGDVIYIEEASNQGDVTLEKITCKNCYILPNPIYGSWINN